MQIFDTHVHYPVNFFQSAKIDVKQGLINLEQLVETCAKLNIVKICLLGGPGRINDLVLDGVRRYPELIVPLAYLPLDEARPDTVKKYVDQGFKGLKLICPRKNYDDPGYYPMYEAAEREGLVCLFHTGILGGVVDYLQDEAGTSPALMEDVAEFERVLKETGTSSFKMQPLYLDTIGILFPELKIIGAHLGYGMYEIACAVARWRRNVSFDISGGNVVRRHILEGQLIRKEIQVRKMVFGSDSRTERIKGEIDAWMEELAKIGLTETEIAAIFYHNAARMFDL